MAVVSDLYVWGKASILERSGDSDSEPENASLTKGLKTVELSKEGGEHKAILAALESSTEFNST